MKIKKGDPKRLEAANCSLKVTGIKQYPLNSA